MMDHEDTDPAYTVWDTVATLEQKGYTRTEIADALMDVGRDIKYD